MNQTLKNLLAIAVGILPINVIMIWYRLTQTDTFTTIDMLVYPLLFGGGNIVLILVLNKFLLKQKIKDFNPGSGKWYWDITAGIILTIIYFGLLIIEQKTITDYLPQAKPASQELINLLVDLANNPVLLAIWLGPVVWIGVALFEELQRIFFLNCLWKLSGNHYWQLFTIFLVSVIWGVTHLYQGTFGIISVSIQGLVMSLYYYRYRRIWPLIVSHALYDSVQIMMMVIQIRS